MQIILKSPIDRPATIPVELIVATVGLEHDHVTPAIDVKVAVPPTHTDVGPVITGVGFTVTGAVR